MTSNLETDVWAVVDVWSDIMCPFCYMGHELLSRAVDQFEHPVKVHYHSFQLMPHLSADEGVDLADLLERERGFPRSQAAEMNARVTERAAQLGLEYNLDRAVGINTRAAHRLIHYAAVRGLQDEMVERVFRAYFTDGLNTGDYGVLADLAAEIGLDRVAAREALDNGAYDDTVDRDIQQARELGINGVPFFVFDSKYAVSGAQPIEVFVRALHTTWEERSGSTPDR